MLLVYLSFLMPQRSTLLDLGELFYPQGLEKGLLEFVTYQENGWRIGHGIDLFSPDKVQLMYLGIEIQICVCLVQGLRDR